MIKTKKIIETVKSVFIKISIQWFLFIVLSLSIVTITIVLGFNLFRIYTIDIKENETDKLRIIARDWYKFVHVQMDQLNRILKREEVLVEKRMQDLVLFIKPIIKKENYAFGEYDELYKYIGDKNIDLMVVSRDGNIFYSNENNLRNKSLKKLVGSVGVSELFDNWDSFMSLNADNVYTLHVEWPINTNVVRKSIMVFSFDQGSQNLFVLRMFYEDFKSFELKRIIKNELRDMMAQEKIGPRGYIWVFDAEGRYVVSKDRLRDRESIYDEKGPDSSYPAREIMNKAFNLRGSETDVHYYYWKNIGESPKMKVAAFSYVPEWGWIIGASSYEEDFLSELRVYKERIIIIGSTAVLISMIIAFWVSMLFSRPIKKLEYFARMISEGNLDVDISQKESFLSKEICGLFQSFKSMAGSIKFQIETIQNSKTHFEELNEELLSSKEVLEENNNYLMSEIEQRLNTEYKLIEQKELVNTIVSNISKYVYWKDSNLNYLGCNKKYLKLLKINNSQDIIDRSDEELQQEQLVFKLFPEIEREVIDYGVGFFKLEKRIMINGDFLNVLCDVIPIRSSEEKIVGLIVMMNECDN